MNKEEYDAERFMEGFEDGIKIGLKIFADQIKGNLFMTAAELQSLAGRDLAQFILMFFTELPDAWYEAHFVKSVIDSIKADAAIVRAYWFNTFGGE